MPKIIREKILILPNIDKRKVLSIAKEENDSVDRFIYYLSFLNGKRRDKKKRINKQTYDKELKFAEKVIDLN